MVVAGCRRTEPLDSAAVGEPLVVHDVEPKMHSQNLPQRQAVPADLGYFSLFLLFLLIRSFYATLNSCFLATC